jgi:hypothetical protein
MKNSYAVPASLLAVTLLAGCAGASASGRLDRALATQAAQRVANMVPHQNAIPHASAVTIVIMENRDYKSIIGNSSAPYINHTLVPMSALMTNSHAIGHPSEPNYLELFSGSNQGVVDDSCPHTFHTANLGSELIGAGKTFAGYSESMPSNGYTGCQAGNLYARKHNPWVNFTNVPASSNLVYKGWPASPPTVAIVVPNLCNDMHDCSTKTGDTWLKNNLPPIMNWNSTHDGLLILTWDEAAPDPGSNPVATLLTGPMITQGKYNQHVTHYDVLRTVEDIFHLACTAGTCSATDLTGMWK